MGSEKVRNEKNMERHAKYERKERAFQKLVRRESRDSLIFSFNHSHLSNPMATI